MPDQINGIVLNSMQRLPAVFFCSLVFLGGRLAAQAPLFPLPKDEKEAYVMMKEGTLDSGIWQMVRPYYDQPLLVPVGELRILADIFPESLAGVPTSPQELSAYEPWKEADVKRFFGDFPELVNFYPILSFETMHKKYYARVGIMLHKYSKEDPLIVTSLMSAPAANVSLDGRVGFDATSARWQRRMMGLRTAHAGKLTLGNFHWNMDRGLFYGYFPSIGSDTDAALNWRYAESNTWNGMLYESPEEMPAAAVAFYHQRQNETAYGGRCGVGKIGHFSVLVGASHLIIPRSEAGGGDFTYAHAEVHFLNDHWNAGAIGGCERMSPGAIPFIAYAKHSMKGPDSTESAGFEVSYARMPPGKAMPRSALSHECIEKTDKVDSAAIGRSLVKTLCRLPLTSWVKSACGASYYYSIGHPAAEGFISLSGVAWLDYSLRYTFRPVIDRSPQYHCMTVSLGRDAARGVSIRTYCRYINKEESYQSVYMRLSSNITGLPAMDVAPFAAVYAASDRDREFSLGLTQTLRLFEKTWGELKAEVPIIKTFQDQWVIDAKAYFYF